MPVRLRITLAFTALVFFILGLVCVGIYYVSYETRINTLNTRLTNRAITTARLLSQREIFDQTLVRRIDSLTTLALKNKTVQAYNDSNQKIYNYSDLEGDTLSITSQMLDDAREKGKSLFVIGDKEAVAYHFNGPQSSIVVVTAAEDEDGRENLRNLKRILLWSFVIGIILVIVAGYFFSRRLLLPIKKISEDVTEISAQNLARRIQTGSAKDEWHQMSTTINALLDRLQESFELQQRFISNASHELSTPLTSISSQLEVAMQRERDAADYLKVMKSIHQDVQHMSKLTQTLLEFAKASGSKSGTETSLIRCDEILMQLPSEVVKLNSLYNVKLDFVDLPDDEQRLLVFGNYLLLFTAIKNIVINSCKYSVDHTATVRLRPLPNRIEISIIDTGVGIPPQEIANIFQPFYRVSENASVGGFGLGLSLAERIIKIHKGTLDVVSTEGKGSVFTITLPAAANLKYL